MARIRQAYAFASLSVGCNTRASILLVILTHGASNAVTQLLVQVIPMNTPLSGWLQALVPDWLNVIAFGTAALLLLLLTRGQLSYKGERQLE